jgi:hypothetical protein
MGVVLGCQSWKSERLVVLRLDVFLFDVVI